MKDDPQEIAAWLIQEYGQEDARRAVLSGLFEAYKAGDFYAVSVWREVRCILSGPKPPALKRTA